LRKASGVIGSGLLAASLPLGALAQEKKAEPSKAPEQKDKKPEVEFRKLGRTGLMVTTVSMGVMNCSDPAVVRRAYDLGINFFDTAHTYMGGKNEVMVGEVLKDVRDKVCIETKVHQASESEMMGLFETSLQRLKMDHVEMLLIHGLDSAAAVNDEKIIGFLEKAKKQGKARFTGFSTHSSVAECLKAAAASKKHDVILAAYNFKSGADVKEAIAACVRAGIGIIGMKTLAGGYADSGFKGLSAHQAALKWVLQDTNVACAIPGVRSIKEIEELAVLMGKKMTAGDYKTLEGYERAFAQQLCSMCGTCAGQCPYGVPVQDVMRSLMYYEGYKDIDLARTTYAALARRAPLAQCGDCASCPVRCANRLAVQSRMRSALRYLG
jgi:predicted aldo/keto reductase-like oxidoreductase